MGHRDSQGTQGLTMKHRDSQGTQGLTRDTGTHMGHRDSQGTQGLTMKHRDSQGTHGHIVLSQGQHNVVSHEINTTDTDDMQT